MTKFLGFCTGALALVLATQASAQVVTLTTTMNGGEETPVSIPGWSAPPKSAWTSPTGNWLSR